MRLCYSIVTFMALLMLLAGASVLTGCGKKGPLYLPEQPQQVADPDKKTSGKSK